MQNLDPTYAMTHQVRDANAADRARQALRREKAIAPPAQENAAFIARGLGVPVQLVQRILTLAEQNFLLSLRVNELETDRLLMDAAIRSLTERVTRIENKI
jgi:predicted solute-binding protein